MPEDWPIPEELLRKEAGRISARYRVSAEDAVAALAEVFARNPKLADRIRRRHGHEDVTRWRDYREAVKECRKQVYYDLRRYYPDADSADRLVDEFEREVAGPARAARVEELRLALLGLHTSTRERSAQYAEFTERFFELAGSPATLLDVGCGMHPLSYPFEGAGSATRLYVALDKDPRAIRALSAYARLVGPDRLVVVRARLEEPGWLDEVPSTDPFDLAVMLKVVPVVNRLDRSAVQRLYGVPARRILLTGNAGSMTRRKDIEARERAVLRRFIEESGRRTVGEFRAGDEFGYLLE